LSIASARSGNHVGEKKDGLDQRIETAAFVTQ